MGGGSVAALSAALSAALLEKLVVDPRTVRRLRRMWRECLALIDRDATTFARVIQATRTKNQAAFRRSLKRAIDVPRRVFEHAWAVQATCRTTERAVKPQLHSDLRCARALAHAAAESARALIETNLRWLGDPAYATRIRRQLTAAMHADAR